MDVCQQLNLAGDDLARNPANVEKMTTVIKIQKIIDSRNESY